MKTCISPGRKRIVYNLADIVRWNYCYYMDSWSSDSIARQYYHKSQAPKNQYDKTKNPIVDFNCLSDVVESKNIFEHDDNVLSIHVRLGDLFNTLQQTIPKTHTYLDIIKKYNLNERCDKCHLFFGNHLNENKTQSQEYINKLSSLLSDAGFDVSIVSGSVDDDFVKLSRCKNYIPSIRGFSWLSASINPNNVIWDIQNPPLFDWNISRKSIYIDSRISLNSGLDYHKKISEQ